MLYFCFYKGIFKDMVIKKSFFTMLFVLFVIMGGNTQGGKISLDSLGQNIQIDYGFFLNLSREKLIDFVEEFLNDDEIPQEVVNLLIEKKHLQLSSYMWFWVGFAAVFSVTMPIALAVPFAKEIKDCCRGCINSIRSLCRRQEHEEIV